MPPTPTDANEMMINWEADDVKLILSVLKMFWEVKFLWLRPVFTRYNIFNVCQVIQKYSY